MESPTILQLVPYSHQLVPKAVAASGRPDISDLCRGQKHGLSYGKHALVDRHSTVSFHSRAKPENHGNRPNRCSSAPDLLVVGIEGNRLMDEGNDVGKGATKSTDLLPVPVDIESWRDILSANGQNKQGVYQSCGDLSFRSSSTASLQLTTASTRPKPAGVEGFGNRNELGKENCPPGMDHGDLPSQANQVPVRAGAKARPDEGLFSNGFGIETDARSTSESDDGLTPVEIQAMGAFVPLQYTHGFDRGTGSEDGAHRCSHLCHSGVCTRKIQGYRYADSRNWRAAIARAFHRGTAESQARSLSKKSTVYSRTGKPTHTIPKGVDPQIAAVKKRPSLFLRLVNRTLKDHNHSHTGYERIPNAATVFDWTDSVFTRLANLAPLTALSGPFGESNSALVNELCRYFGSGEVKKQLTLSTSKAKNVFIHHPINVYILDRRYARQVMERNFEGRPPRSKRSCLSLRNSTFSSTSGVRILNRHGENWKLLEFSKAACPSIGDGRLSLDVADLLSKEKGLAVVRRSSTRSYASMWLSACPRPIPVRRSSKTARTVSMPKSMRRSSISTIGWAESISEFDGDVGSVHVSGARMLVDDEPPPTARTASWGYVDPEDLGPPEPAYYNHILRQLQSDATAVSEKGSSADVEAVPERPAQVVASGQWIGALQIMQEYEQEAQKKCKPRRGPRTISKSSRGNRTSSNPGYVDDELREACKMAMMSASVLESRRRSATVLV